MRRAALTAVQAGLLLLPLVLGFASGGFFTGPRLVAAICAWALLAVAVVAVPGPLLPVAPAARVALAALAGLAAWTWVAAEWSPSPAGAAPGGGAGLPYRPAVAGRALG